MSTFLEMRHDVWIDAPRDLVRDHFADLDHHVETGVHPEIGLRRLDPDERGRTRFEQVVRLLGRRRRDVFERRHLPDGSIVDTSVEGAHRGGTVTVAFEREAREGRLGTLVMIDLRLPLPPVVGPVLRPMAAAQLRRLLQRAGEEDRRDLESGRYADALGLGFPRAA